MVQFERSGNWGNLRRALISMPWWYAKRLVRGGLKGRTENDRFLGREIRGYLSGLTFYARAPKPGSEGAAE
jgi:hypothetical protein